MLSSWLGCRTSFSKALLLSKAVATMKWSLLPVLEEHLTAFIFIASVHCSLYFARTIA